MSFENSIQQWVILDNQLKLYNEKIKELREKRNELSVNINKHVHNNKLAESTVQISDGKIKFVTTRVAEPLTFKYLEKTLGEIIKNENQVKTILEHIKQKREIKSVQEIKRFYRN
jgi:hypothetical protein